VRAVLGSRLRPWQHATQTPQHSSKACREGKRGRGSAGVGSVREGTAVIR
jgi:hypothetical protein